MKLNLKKQHAGYYSNTAGSLTISVNNGSLEALPSDKVEWNLTIEDYSVQDEPLVRAWFKTKREAYKCAVNWLISDSI
jgi:hypothetical protein